VRWRTAQRFFGVRLTTRATTLPVVLSEAKDLMLIANGDEVLRCAQDDRVFMPFLPVRRRNNRCRSSART
jgi:hypothetical protein